MVLFDYIFYIVYIFITGLRKINSSNILERTRITFSMIWFSIFMTIFSIIYAFLLTMDSIDYNKSIIILSGIFIFISNNIFAYFRYKKKNYYNIVKKQKEKFKYTNKKATRIFLFILFGSSFLVWLSILLIRKFIL